MSTVQIILGFIVASVLGCFAVAAISRAKMPSARIKAAYCLSLLLSLFDAPDRAARDNCWRVDADRALSRSPLSTQNSCGHSGHAQTAKSLVDGDFAGTTACACHNRFDDAGGGRYIIFEF